MEFGHLYVKLLCLKFGFELVMGLPAYQIEWTRRASRRPCDVKINMAAQDGISQILIINNLRIQMSDFSKSHVLELLETNFSNKINSTKFVTSGIKT